MLAAVQGKSRPTTYASLTRVYPLDLLPCAQDGTTPEEGFAQLVGLCLVTEDLDSLVASLPEEGIGAARAAVQPGRRIAPLRHKHYGISVHTAFMSPHISN